MKIEKHNIECTIQTSHHIFCLHTESGSTGIPKICTRNYECRHCAFDQWLDEMEARHASGKNHKFFRIELDKAA